MSSLFRKNHPIRSGDILIAFGRNGGHCKITERDWHGQLGLSDQERRCYLHAVRIRNKRGIIAATAYLQKCGFKKVTLIRSVD